MPGRMPPLEPPAGEPAERNNGKFDWLSASFPSNQTVCTVQSYGMFGLYRLLELARPAGCKLRFRGPKK